MATAIGTYVTLADLRTRLGLASDVTRDAIMTQIVDETNQWIESYVGRVLAPVGSATYTFDGGGPEVSSSGVLDLSRLGARAVTLVEYATTTGGSFTTIPSNGYFLRPAYRSPGEPYTHLYLDTPYSFYEGYGTVRVTMTAGLAAVPDDVRGVAIAIATRAWHGRQTGQADIVGNDETGAPLVSSIVAPEHKRTLDRYRILQPIL